MTAPNLLIAGPPAPEYRTLPPAEQVEALVMNGAIQGEVGLQCLAPEAAFFMSDAVHAAPAQVRGHYPREVVYAATCKLFRAARLSVTASMHTSTREGIENPHFVLNKTGYESSDAAQTIPEQETTGAYDIAAAMRAAVDHRPQYSSRKAPSEQPKQSRATAHAAIIAEVNGEIEEKKSFQAATQVELSAAMHSPITLGPEEGAFVREAMNTYDPQAHWQGLAKGLFGLRAALNTEPRQMPVPTEVFSSRGATLHSILARLLSHASVRLTPSIETIVRFRRLAQP